VPSRLRRLRPNLTLLFVAAFAASVALDGAEARRRADVAAAETIAVFEMEAKATVAAAADVVRVPRADPAWAERMARLNAHVAGVAALQPGLDPTRRHFAETYRTTLDALAATALDETASSTRLHMAHGRVRRALERLLAAGD
jgi:hypothetical protein